MAEALYPVPDNWAADALIGEADYTAMYRRSVEDPEGFWREEAQRIDWIRPFTRVKDTSFAEAYRSCLDNQGQGLMFVGNEKEASILLREMAAMPEQIGRAHV